MTGKMVVAGRMEKLRSYEEYCYQVAYYLLGEEEEAILAAKSTLLELGQDGGFWRASEDDRQKQVKRRAMMQSLELRRRQGMSDMIPQKSAYIC